MSAITQHLKGLGYDCVPDSFYTRIALWQKWYRGTVPAVHNYRQYNGRKEIRRSRKKLGMAKTVAEDWASLALNEKVDIVLAKKTAQAKVWAVLDANEFRVRGNQLLEQAFAMGTGAIVESFHDGKIRLDYIRAGMIYPLTWDNGVVTECAFASEHVTQKEKQVSLSIHRLDHGLYVVENHLFRRNGQALTEIDLPEDVVPEEHTGSAIPRFQLIRPNIVNNLDPDCPMGLSVYANALDQLECCDLVYDSYCNEFRLGRKRITIPLTMARMAMEEDGSITPVFDDNDTEFYAVPAAEGMENKIQEHNMELRYEAHEAGVQTALSMLSFKCGMGKDRYIFKEGQVKTATEIISEKSDLYQNLKKHEILLGAALKRMVQAILDMLKMDSGIEITVSFDDSIIEDVGTEKLRFLQEIRDGVRQKWEYRVKFFGEDEKTAKTMAATEQPAGLFGGGDG